MGGDDAVAKMQAGASLVQVYTGFIYSGPDIVRECVEAIRAARAAAPHGSAGATARRAA